jgi:predicted enzyme involved in methoxymalonyl-ACP biosynthesis
MLKNSEYNLVETIAIISRSLYRYDQYMKDLDKEKCESCRKLWTQFREHREKELKLLLEELKTHVEMGMLSD